MATASSLDAEFVFGAAVNHHRVHACVSKEAEGVSHGVSVIEIPVESIPEELDYRPDFWLVEDQKKSGACVGFAGAALLTWALRKAGRLPYDSTDPMNPRFYISPRYLWMASKEMRTEKPHDLRRPTTFLDSSGAYIDDALFLTLKFGAATEAMLPFSPASGFFSTVDEKSFYKECADYAPDSVGDIPVKLFRSHLVNYGPIAVSFRVCDAFLSSKGEVLSKYERPPKDLNRGHAVLVVGFIKKMVGDMATTCYVIRNSWGVAWGDNGYCYVTLAYAKKAFLGGVGVAAKQKFPPVVEKQTAVGEKSIADAEKLF